MKFSTAIWKINSSRKLFRTIWQFVLLHNSWGMQLLEILWWSYRDPFVRLLFSDVILGCGIHVGCGHKCILYSWPCCHTRIGCKLHAGSHVCGNTIIGDYCEVLKWVFLETLCFWFVFWWKSWPLVLLCFHCVLVIYVDQGNMSLLAYMGSG